MFRQILVPLDGSVFAEHAVPLAVSLGKQTGATVRFLRVVPPLADFLFLPPQLNDPLDAELRGLHRSEAQAYLKSVAERLKGAGPMECDVMEEDEGVSESICAAVKNKGVDLIVLSSHGRGAVARFWLGSIADRLIRTAPVPVLLARPPEQAVSADLQQPVALKHILVALSGDTAQERVVEPALAMGQFTSAEFTLVCIVRPAFPHLSPHIEVGSGEESSLGPSGLGKRDALNWQKAEDYLRGVAERLRASGARVQTRIRVAEQPAAAILREASSLGADLIALETHGRGASRLLIGSVADKVVRGSPIPVLVCRLSS